MKQMVIYLLLGAVALTLYWGGYRLLFRRRSAWMEQRVYLLVAALLSMVMPLLRLPMLSGAIALQRGAAAISEQPSSADGISPMSVVATVLVVTYLLVAVFNAIGMLYNQAVIYKELKRLPATIKDGIRIHYNPQGTLSYAYGRHVVLGTQGLTPQEAEMIAAHEMAHVRRGHTYDLMIMQLMEIVFWFNPLTRKYTAELKKLHDFVADAEALHGVDKQAYARLLCARTNIRQEWYHPATVLCNFRSGDFLTRVKMLYTPAQSRRPLCLLAILPLLALTITINSCADPHGESLQKIKAVPASASDQSNTCIGAPQQSVEIEISQGETTLHVNGSQHIFKPHDSTMKVNITSASDKEVSPEDQRKISKIISHIVSAAIMDTAN